LTVEGPFEIKSAAEWSAAIAVLPPVSVLQTWMWGDLKSRWGWRPVRLVWNRDGVTCAAAQVLVRPLAAGRGFAYVPHGPIADRQDLATWGHTLDGLEAWARSRRAVVLKVELDIAASNLDLRQLLEQRGWTVSHEAIQFPHTMLSDIQAPPAELLAAMKPKTRYNIRLAERRGVEISVGGVEHIDALWALYRETADRDGFAVRTSAYYRDAWTALLTGAGSPTEPRAAVVLARYEGVPLAANLTVVLGETAYYMYGATASVGRDHMPAYLAQWHAVLWSREAGARTYDWWGAPTVLAESDPLWGVARFKAGFGARRHERLGPWDYAPSAIAYRVYRDMTAARRHLLHAPSKVRRAVGRVSRKLGLERLFQYN
jgi:peptidoglycan pentaglycine glycine transferase (the first glycine)